MVCKGFTELIGLNRIPILRTADSIASMGFLDLRSIKPMKSVKKRF